MISAQQNEQYSFLSAFFPSKCVPTKKKRRKFGIHETIVRTQHWHPKQNCHNKNEHHVLLISLKKSTLTQEQSIWCFYGIDITSVKWRKELGEENQDNFIYHIITLSINILHYLNGTIWHNKKGVKIDGDPYKYWNCWLKAFDGWMWMETVSI